MLNTWSIGRQLALTAAIAALAFGLTLVFDVATLYRYEQLTDRVQREDLGDLRQMATWISELSEVHGNFIALLADARMNPDEQVIYLRGRAFDKRLEPLLMAIAQNADDSPQLAEARRLLEEYRGTAMTTIEMLTVNPTLVERYWLRAAMAFTGINHALASQFQLHHDRISQEIEERQRELRKDAMFIGLVLLVLSLVIFRLIDRIRWNIAGRFATVAQTLARLKSDRIGDPIEVSEGQGEYGEVLAGLAGFRDALVERNFAQHQMQAIFNNIHEAVFVIDAGGSIVTVNAAACGIFGYAIDELVGHNISRIVPAEHAGSHDGYITRYLATGETRIIGNGRRVEGLHRMGQLIPVNLTVNHIMLDGASYFVGIITDLSEMLEREQVLRTARDAAETANQIKSDFLANMSHELRTPLNGIIGMTDLALDASVETAERQEYLQIVRQSAAALQNLINDILDFSHSEVGNPERGQQHFDLPELLQQSLADPMRQAHAKGLTLDLAIAPAVPGMVSGDPQGLRQVLARLLDNAVKFTDRGGIDVRVSLEPGGAPNGYLHFAIRDSGIGIAADRHERIFEAFAQGDSSRTRRHGGMGLGLSLARRSVERMGGRLWLESTVGAGSTFHFTCVFNPAATHPMPENLGENSGMPTDNAANAVPSPSTFDYAAALRAMDAETIEILTPAFLDHYAVDVDALRQAIAAGDAVSTQRHAHSLKGTLAAFGARPAEQQALAIESRAKNGDLAGLDAQLTLLVAEIESLAAVLRA